MNVARLLVRRGHVRTYRRYPRPGVYRLVHGARDTLLFVLLLAIFVAYLFATAPNGA